MNQLTKLYMYGLMLLITIGLASCKKENTNSQNSTTDELKGDFTLEFEHFFGKELFELNKTFTNNNKIQFNFSKLTYYVSNIELKKSDGTIWKETNSYYLNNLTDNPLISLLIKNVPKGEYSEISFVLGIDSTTNVSGVPDGVLSHSNNMFWNSKDGYIFMKLEGTSPQCKDGDFSFHVGGFYGKYNAVQNIILGFQSYTLMIKPNAIPKVHLRINIENVFNTEKNQIDVANISKTNEPDSITQQISENFKQCFSFEHIHN